MLERLRSIPKSIPSSIRKVRPPRDFYLLKAGWLVLRHGFSTLKQAVAGGQYEYPKGLFFGGKRLEQGPEKYQSFIARRLASAEQLVAIDVHTGLGEYGEDTLLVESNDYDPLRQMFGERVAPMDAEQSPAYATRGRTEVHVFLCLT